MSLSASSTSSESGVTATPGSSEEPENPTVWLSQPMIWVFAQVGLTFPFYPIYFSGIGLSDSKIAILLAVPPISMLFGGQFIGWLSDVHLTRKSMLVLLSLGCALATILFPLTNSYPLLLLLMMFQALTLMPRISIANALILSSADGEKRYGVLRCAGSLSFVAVGIIAATLGDHDPERGISWIFPIAALCNVLCAITALPLKERPPSARRAEAVDGASFLAVQRTVLREPVVRVFMIFLLISQVPHSLSVMFQSRLITDPNFIGGSNLAASMALNIGAIMEMIVFLAFHRIVKRVRLMPLFFIAAAAQIVRWAVVFAYPVLWVVQATNVLNMLTYGLMHICSVVLINREVPGHLRASGQTLLAIVYMSLSSIAGTLIGAVFFNYGTVLQWYGIAAVLVLFSLPFWLKMKRLYEAKHQVSGFWVK